MISFRFHHLGAFFLSEIIAFPTTLLLLLRAQRPQVCYMTPRFKVNTNPIFTNVLKLFMLLIIKVVKMLRDIVEL